ncbi:MAG: tripartite tricarboxylate transporter substrate binding protein [Pseudomonadota bacterium]
MYPSRRSVLAQLACTVALTPAWVGAQLGEQPIKLIVPLPPGSGGDNIARILVQPLRELLKQTILVENRPGGDMMIAASLAAKAPADGCTLLLAHMSTMVLNPLAYASVNYDAKKDFRPIGKISESTAVVVVNPSVPARTMSEFVSYVRENPGKVSYGTAILMVQVSGEQLVHTRRLQMTRVPYKGGAQVMQDTVARHIDMSIADASSYIALIRAGKLHPLVTTGPQRNPLLPDVPTAREAGFPEMEVSGWWGLFAPAKTPRGVTDRVSAALQTTLAMPEVIKQLRAIGAQPQAQSGDALGKEMLRQSEQWGEAFRTLKIRITE